MEAPAAEKGTLSWVKAAKLPFRTRATVCVTFAVAYLILFVAVGPNLASSLRPLNLVFVALAGLLFGARGGFLLGAAAAAVNLTLYWRFGILAQTPGMLYGNILSIFVGVAVGAGIGRMRDLSLRLRFEVARRQEAERRKEELTALLVHDLKNPLTAISGHAQLLALGELDTEAERIESAHFIHLAADRLGRMLMNLLDIGRAEEGRLLPRYEPIELGRLLEEVHSAMQPHLMERQQQLVVVQRAEKGLIHADPELVRRILLNLLENAVKYTPPRRTVRLELHGTDDDIELRVVDEGPGVPAGFEDRIFEKYVRLDRDASTAADASRGLGLHFCKLAATAHGGSIRVEQNVPHGSVFCLMLPRSPPART